MSRSQASSSPHAQTGIYAPRCIISYTFAYFPKWNYFLFRNLGSPQHGGAPENKRDFHGVASRWNPMPPWVIHAQIAGL